MAGGNGLLAGSGFEKRCLTLSNRLMLIPQ
jgi:hypothetical protein